MSKVRDTQDALTRALIAAQLSVLTWGEEDCGIMGQSSDALEDLKACLEEAEKLLKIAKKLSRP